MPKNVINCIVDNVRFHFKQAPRRVVRALDKRLSYLVQGHKFAPAFRNGRWDGREHLLRYSRKHGYSAPVGLLPDAVKLFKKHKIDLNIDDQRPEPEFIKFGWNPSIKLRDYQLEAVEAITKAGLYRGRGILKLPIRSGKTVTAAAIIRELGATTLFLVPSAMLLHQARESLAEALECPVGIIGDGHFEEADVTVATLQTLAKRDAKRSYDLVIVDECFPAGTLVDGLPIESFKVGDFVSSYDETTGTICRRRVSRVFESKPSALVRVNTARGSIVCTAGHPFFTQRGWVPAFYLTRSDMVLYTTSNETAQSVQDEVPRVQKTSRHFGKDAMASRKNRAWLLLTGLYRRLPIVGFFPNNGKNKPTLCVGTHEETQPDERSSRARKAASDSSSDRPQAQNSRGQRKTAPTSTTSSCGSSRMAHRSSGENEEAKGFGLSAELQDRHRQRDFEDRDRSRRQLPHASEKTSARPQEGSSSAWARVEGIEVLQPGSDGEFGGLCRGGRVYNLGVEGTHTYIAGGFVVHNCHHGKAEVFRKTILGIKSRYKIGLSATAYFDDESEIERGVIWLKATCGDIRVDVSTSRLIEEGYLMRPVIQLYRICKPDLTTWRWSAELRNAAIYENEVRNNKITELTIANVDAGLQVLIVSSRIAHTHELFKRIKECGIDVHSITGKEKTEIRRERIKEFTSGRCRVLVGTVFGEGLDIPEIEVVINAEGGKDAKATVQRMRNLTPHHGKTEAIFIDFVDLTNRYFAEHTQERLAVYRSEEAFRVKIVE